jgi:hypothetical protein
MIEEKTFIFVFCVLCLPYYIRERESATLLVPDLFMYCVLHARRVLRERTNKRKYVQQQ